MMIHSEPKGTACVIFFALCSVTFFAAASARADVGGAPANLPTYEVAVSGAPSVSGGVALQGRVLDAATGFPLAGAQVRVGTKVVESDARGEFLLELATGRHAVAITRAGYIALELPPAEYAAGAVDLSEQRLVLEGGDDFVMLDAVAVVADLAKNSVVTERRSAQVAVDLLSAEDFGKFTGSDVADIVVRVPGLSTTSRGSFAVVRGLAERYNPVLLDGIVLPSSDPERQSPQLDIFPNKLVDAIVITKAYEPSLPGTASGAAIDLRTKPIPDERKTEVQLGVRADEGFIKVDDFLGASGGGTLDWFGLGAHERQREAPVGAQISSQPADYAAYTSQANTPNKVKSRNFPPGGRFAFTHEDRHVLDEKKKRLFGYVLAYTQDRSASSESGDEFAPSTGGTPSYNRYEESEIENRVGIFGAFGLRVNSRHAFNLNVFHSQVGLERSSRESLGLKGDELTSIQVGRDALAQSQGAFPSGLNLDGFFGRDEIYYSQRHLFNLQVGGEHKLGASEHTEVGWNMARIQARQEEPDYLLFPYSYVNPFADSNDLANFFYTFGQPQGLNRYSRQWRDTVEDTLTARADVRTEWLLAGTNQTSAYGVYLESTDREYSENSFELGGGSIVGDSLDQLILDLQDQLINPGNQPLVVREQVGSAIAERQLHALYFNQTWAIFKAKPTGRSLNFSLGARLEDFNLESSGAGRIGNTTSAVFYQELEALQGNPGQTPRSEPINGKIEEVDLLPAVALKFSPREGINLRGAYAQTKARPSFREMGSYFTVDRIAEEYVHGNSDLTVSDVENFDLRFEYFVPQSTDLVALSFFYKTISAPIERVSFPARNDGSFSTFVNNPSDAKVRGLEFEFSKGLGFLGEPLRGFTLGGNATRIIAEVNRDPVFEAQNLAATGESTRSLAEQPEYLANAYLSYANGPLGLDATLSFFAISDTLRTINQSKADTYVAAHTRWDLTLAKRFGKDWRVSFSARNLLDPERRLIGDREQSDSTQIYRSYHDGRSYTITATRSF
jgi:outer membrane receptor protein involved in Fe transport